MAGSLKEIDNLLAGLRYRLVDEVPDTSDEIYEIEAAMQELLAQREMLQPSEWEQESSA